LTRRPRASTNATSTGALDELAAGSAEILADDVSRQVRAGLAGGVAALYRALA
jgi:hypothetical protein